jgi:WXG100 family type VII secretion target
MAQLGADVEQLDRLARKFDEESQQITQAVSQINSQVQSAWWKGNDADRFRSEWQGTYASQLRRIADALRQVGTSVRRQASEQRQASGN